MKTLKEYLTESIRAYRFKILVAGEPEQKWIDLFLYNLNQKFACVVPAKVKTTPIQKVPYGFPELKDSSVFVIDVDFRYPVNEDMIRQVARLMKYDVNKIRVLTGNYVDTLNQEIEKYENQMNRSPLLQQAELEDNGKEANKAYANQYLDSIKSQMEKDKEKIDYAGEETKIVFDPFKAIPKKIIDGNSPISNIKLPSIPKIGSTR
jgi:hypothetical protein